MASCLMIRKSVLTGGDMTQSSSIGIVSQAGPRAAIGVMDERFPMFYNDVDVSKRMADAGWKTAYVADATVVHRHGASTRQVRARMIPESHRSAFRYLRKHDHSGLFWLKAIVLLPLLETTTLVRVLAFRLRRHA